MQGWEKRENLEETRRAASSSSMIPTCENPGVTRLRLIGNTNVAIFGMMESGIKMARKLQEIEKLGEENWLAWSRRVRAALEQKRWWEAIEPGYSGITDEDLTPKQASKDKDALEENESAFSNGARAAFLLLGLPRTKYGSLIRSIHSADGLNLQNVKNKLMLEERQEKLQMGRDENKAKALTARSNTVEHEYSLSPSPENLHGRAHTAEVQELSKGKKEKDERIKSGSSTNSDNESEIENDDGNRYGYVNVTNDSVEPIVNIVDPDIDDNVNVGSSAEHVSGELVVDAETINSVPVSHIRSVEMGWELQHVDVNAAFLNSSLKTPVFMKIPELCKDNVLGDEYACELQKSIYGLHQAVKDWNEHISDLMLGMNMKQCMSDPCVFFSPYEELIAVLPDIAFTVGKLSRKCHEPSVEDWKGVKHVMRYLVSTQNYQMKYRRDKPIVKVFCDADWANDRDAKSASGCAVFMGNCLVGWKS
ncbi:hypothetical protein PR048_014493 [Dryococelus australis]|uniref:Reverse transcriptase Ty1/copia-type domain-containing protein n=1 Tax=Dryococelus australis TaxID=614101 RepID=A0ABQ9HES2_9NEOP|nr:hypothetical protein PR048_014493 [Dryococelus australis]